MNTYPLRRLFYAIVLAVVSIGLGILFIAHTKADGAIPTARCVEPVRYLGTIERSQTVEAVFEIANDGGAGLRLIGTKADCGCTVAVLDSQNVAPGGRARVNVAFDVNGRPGKKSARVVVETDDPNHKSINLQVSCLFAPRVFLSVSSVDLGQFNDTDTEAGYGEFGVYPSSDELRFQIIGVNLTRSPGLNAKIIPDSLRHGYRVALSNGERLPAGRYNGIVTIQTDDEDANSLSCRVSARVRGSISVQPDFISMNPEDIGDAGIRYCLRVVPGYVESFRLLGVSTPGRVNASVEQKGPYYLVTLDNIPGDCTLDGEAVILRTDVAGKEEISVPITMRGCD